MFITTSIIYIVILSFVYFLVFLITCCRIIWISHLQIPCSNKGCNVTLSVLGMHADTNSVKYLFGCTRYGTEIYYVPLLVRQ